MNKTITVARANKNNFGLDSLEECGMHAISIVGEPAKHNMERNKQHGPWKFALDNTIYSYIATKQKALFFIMWTVTCMAYVMFPALVQTYYCYSTPISKDS